MTKTNLKRIFIIMFLAYAVFATSFYFLGGDQLKYKPSEGNILMPDADSVTTEIIRGDKVSQVFFNTIEDIDEVTVSFAKLYKDVSGSITVFLYDGDLMLAKTTIDLAGNDELFNVTIKPKEPLQRMKNRFLTIRVITNSNENHGAVALMRENSPGSHVMFNNETYEGTLCFSTTGRDESYVGRYYWQIAAAIGALLVAFLLMSYLSYLRQKPNLLVIAIAALYRYEFLISQLVVRDFKSKYKRSILGVFWSFLNPLLTMTVQFLVFSTFFKADTQNYPLYLLSGVVCFSFFSECTTMCLSSVSGNARLITKVYIPKYIFPLARTISSSINLGISLIPLFLACLFLGSVIRPQAILFFYFLACLIVFSLGIGLFLSALMVFFRDIQFLWTVLIQIWMYATPIFYPAEIIPEKYRFIVRFNPLYHFIGNARTCLINGVSPEPRAYLFCLIFAVLSLLIGAFTFKKTQDKFALYL